MKKILMVVLSIVCCITMATPLYARDGRGRGSRSRSDKGRTREAVTDNRIERRAEREADRKKGRVQERHPDDPLVVEKRNKMIDHKTQKQIERRDKVRGDEGKEIIKENLPEMREAADLDGDGKVSREERHDYNERIKDTHKDIKSSKRDLEIENAKEYKDLVSKYDADGDGELNKDEWAVAQPEFKETFGENVTEKKDLYELNKEKRHDLLEPPAPPEE